MIVNCPIPGRTRFFRIEVDVAEAEMTRTFDDSKAAWPEAAHSLGHRSTFLLIKLIVDSHTSADGHIVASCCLDGDSYRPLSL